MRSELEKKRILINIQKMEVAKMEMELKIEELYSEIERKQERLEQQEQLIKDEKAKMDGSSTEEPSSKGLGGDI